MADPAKALLYAELTRYYTPGLYQLAWALLTTGCNFQLTPLNRESQIGGSCAYFSVGGAVVHSMLFTKLCYELLVKYVHTCTLTNVYMYVPM